MDEQTPDGIDQHAPGAKLDAGKTLSGVLYDFRHALNAIAEVGTFGANKYSRGGWQHVVDGVTRYTDAKWRHLLDEGVDDDSGLSHAAHEAWNTLAALELRLRSEWIVNGTAVPTVDDSGVNISNDATTQPPPYHCPRLYDHGWRFVLYNNDMIDPMLFVDDPTLYPDTACRRESVYHLRIARMNDVRPITGTR